MGRAHNSPPPRAASSYQAQPVLLQDSSSLDFYLKEKPFPKCKNCSIKHWEIFFPGGHFSRDSLSGAFQVDLGLEMENEKSQGHRWPCLILATDCYQTSDTKPGSPSMELFWTLSPTWALWISQGTVSPVGSFDWAALISVEHLRIISLLTASLPVPEIAESEGGLDCEHVL